MVTLNEPASPITSSAMISSSQGANDVGSERVQSPRRSLMANERRTSDSRADYRLDSPSRTAAHPSTNPSEEARDTSGNEQLNSGEDNNIIYNQLVDSVINSVLDFQSRSDKLSTIVPDPTPANITRLETYPNSIEAVCVLIS